MLSFYCCPSYLNKNGLDHFFVNGTFAALSFACTFVISWNDPAPGRECFNGTERRKSWAYLCNNSPGSYIGYSRNCIESLDQIVIWRKQPAETGLNEGDLVF